MRVSVCGVDNLIRDVSHIPEDTPGRWTHIHVATIVKDCETSARKHAMFVGPTNAKRTDNLLYTASSCKTMYTLMKYITESY